MLKPPSWLVIACIGPLFSVSQFLQVKWVCLGCQDGDEGMMPDAIESFPQQLFQNGWDENSPLRRCWNVCEAVHLRQAPTWLWSEFVSLKMVAAFGAPISHVNPWPPCGQQWHLDEPANANASGRFKFAGFQILTFIVGVSSLTILYHHVLTSHADWMIKCNL